MTETTASPAATTDETTQTPKQLDALHTDHGDTTIADTVVEKIAIIAAREVPGVFAMGNAARRAIGNLAGRISSQNVTAGGGVTIEKGERETAIAVSVVVEYGVSIVSVSETIRQNIIQAVEFGTGLEVKSVDVNVSDVHLPDDDADDADTAATAPSAPALR